MDWLRVSLSGLLRSNHALLSLLAIVCLLLFGVAGSKYPIVAYGSFGLFGLIVLGAVCRYVIHGPERDRGQPVVVLAGNRIQIVNFDQEAAESLVRFALRHRQPLPPPSGLIVGVASDEKAIRPLTLEEAQKIAESDARALVEAGTTAKLEQSG